MLNTSAVKKVWLVISPHNPLKEKSSLLNEFDRLHLANLAIEDNPNLKTSQIEFKLPQPSYTIDTLAYLKEKYPQHEFVLIMGGDNLISLPKWKNYQKLLEQYEVLVYKREPNQKLPESLKSYSEKIHLLDVPLLQISSSYIRDCIKQKKSIRYLVTDKVNDYIQLAGYYKN